MSLTKNTFFSDRNSICCFQIGKEMEIISQLSIQDLDVHKTIELLENG